MYRCKWTVYNTKSSNCFLVTVATVICQSNGQGTKDQCKWFNRLILYTVWIKSPVLTYCKMWQPLLLITKSQTPQNYQPPPLHLSLLTDSPGMEKTTNLLAWSRRQRLRDHRGCGKQPDWTAWRRGSRSAAAVAGASTRVVLTVPDPLGGPPPLFSPTSWRRTNTGAIVRRLAAEHSGPSSQRAPTYKWIPLRSAPLDLTVPPREQSAAYWSGAGAPRRRRPGPGRHLSWRRSCSLTFHLFLPANADSVRRRWPSTSAPGVVNTRLGSGPECLSTSWFHCGWYSIQFNLISKASVKIKTALLIARIKKALF